MLRLTKKSLKRRDLFVFAIICIATLLRLILIYFHWPVTNSDEGNMGLLARHVAYNGEWPIFFYGLPYMGPVEGYIAAPLFHLFGPSTFTLRLGLLPFFPLFLICMYYLTRLLFTQRMAVFVVVLLCFGSADIISRQLKAVGEYPELLFFAAFISVAVVWLVLSSSTIDQQKRTTPRRIFIYGILGLVAGIAVWVDFLILPFLGTAIVLLLLFRRRELLSWAGLSLIAGTLIGLFPLLVYNISAPQGQNSFEVLLRLHHGGSAGHIPFMQQVVGTLMISMPNATGFTPRCPVENFPFFGTANVQCIILQGGWGIGYLILWIIAVLLAVAVIWRLWKGRSFLHPGWSFEERQTLIRQCCQLMLQISAMGTILLYILSTDPAIFPEATSRYLECVLVAFPVTLWPLWKGLSAWRTRENWRTTASAIIRGCLLLLLLLMFIQGTFSILWMIPEAQAAYQQQDLMVQKLLDVGATRIYSDYWTCNRLTFQSEEKIICSALDEQLNPDFDRYIKYRYIVGAIPHPAYVFQQGTKDVTKLDARMKYDKQFGTTYQRLSFENYVIYIST
jgi:4-amino-4-deoxy-L-arabinose transferase-like glycosyltransferase